MKAIKKDQGKARMDLVPWDAVMAIAQVFGWAAEQGKYSEFNWALGGMKWTKLAASAMRHLSAWFLGEDKDKESGLPHIAHAGCCCLMVLALILRKNGVDSRFQAGYTDVYKQVHLNKEEE